MKTEIDRINAIPSKRLFLSIIADYDVNRALCELIDNALDLWVRDGRSSLVSIEVELESNQQTIVVSDNSGGVAKSELSFIVGPGQTGNQPTDETIGIFGVGTKRAVVALSQDITIATRKRGSSTTYQIEFDDSWLADESWELPVYEVDSLREGTTIIRLQRLRFRINEDTIAHLREHVGATYARFLIDDKVEIQVNGEPVQPITFEQWSYPPDYPPYRYIGPPIQAEDGGKVEVEIIAGLGQESSPAGGEYGVYLYCNNRLVARGLKSYEVGFTKGLAGQPHPAVSLVRVIVRLVGPAQLMPWNSSKSGINPNHSVFVALREFLIQVVKDFASLSRRWEGQWDEEVFQFDQGQIDNKNIESFPDAKKSYLLPLPKAKPRYADLMAQQNRSVVIKKPWATGLYEGIVAAHLIQKQKLQERNRIALVVLDSTLEIAFKEYLIHDSGAQYSDAKWLALSKNRIDIHKEVQQYVKLSVVLWKKIEHYYGLRNKLVHERATVGITDQQVDDYRDLVELVLKRLFRLTF